MPTPECPICHKRASLEGQQLYCANCGWNRDTAISELRRSTRMMPVGIVMFGFFFLFLFFAWRFRNPVQLAILGGGPAFGILFTYFYVKRRITKLESLAPNIASSVVGSADSSGSRSEESRATVATEFHRQYQALLSTSRPRRIRMAKRGQLNLGVGLLAVLVYATVLGVYLHSVWARTLSFAPFGGKDWLMMALVAVILLIPYGMWRSQVRERDLLENGEIAMGRVTRQWLDEGASSIEYEFKDFLGQSHKGLGHDYTKNLYKDMAVPVFYDTNNPKRQVAYCSTLHEVVI